MMRSSLLTSFHRQSYRRPRLAASQFLSTMPPKMKADDDGLAGDDTPNNNKKQPFVTAKLEPGEWDMNRKDPYFRPKPPRSKLISAEDFANRPPVGFEGEFSTYEDSMIALSWLDSKTCRQIYIMYTDMMLRTEQNHPGRTSHEYICRVLGQKFQITPWRAAGVVQLQHSEEQMRQTHPELLCDEQAHYAEESILQNIRDAYRAERSVPPNRGGSGGGGGTSQPFVEDPVGIHGRGEPDEVSSSWVSTDDIYDLEAKLHEANVRDDELARILIDDHVYKEDVDESTLDVKMDGAARRLLKAAAHGQQRQQQQQGEKEDSTTEIPYPETNAQGVRRPRWKYVAKVVNTRAMRKKGRKIATYTNNNMENTIVEHNGTLRVATVEEAKQVAWKPTRTKGNEYLYEGVKRAWLERTIQGKTGVWGPAPKTSAAAATAQRVAATTGTEEIAESASSTEDIEAASASGADEGKDAHGSNEGVEQDAGVPSEGVISGDTNDGDSDTSAEKPDDTKK